MWPRCTSESAAGLLFVLNAASGDMPRAPHSGKRGGLALRSVLIARPPVPVTPTSSYSALISHLGNVSEQKGAGGGGARSGR